ncbi:MAG: hypothetical protein LAO09_23690 [Acidobacteriia bacterium]|nr:hypothetical protein [Terriglobia bacterium]
MRNAKAKGTRNEHRSKALLEASGYAVCRAAASLGVWDLVAVGSTDFIVVQVKSNRPPSRAERETIAVVSVSGELQAACARVDRPAALAAGDRAVRLVVPTVRRVRDGGS